MAELPKSRADLETVMRMAGLDEAQIEESRTWRLTDVEYLADSALEYVDRISPPKKCPSCDIPMRHHGGFRADAHWRCECGHQEAGL